MKSNNIQLYISRVIFGALFLMIGKLSYEYSIVYQQSIEKATDPLLIVLIWSFIYTVGMVIGIIGIIILVVTFVNAIEPIHMRRH